MVFQNDDPAGNYSVDEVEVTIASVRLTKGVKGDFLTIGRDGTHFTTQTGADGSIVRSRQIDPRRSVWITLPASSPSNDFLKSLRGEGKFSIRVERVAGEVLFAGSAFYEGGPRNVGSVVVWELGGVGSKHE